MEWGFVALAALAGLLLISALRAAARGREGDASGVYVWRGGSYERAGEDWSPGPGVYIVYFHNNRCPACRRFYPALLEGLPRALGSLEGVSHFKVVCEWFSSNCPDPLARRFFREFGVSVSPTLLLVRYGGDGRPRILADLIGGPSGIGCCSNVDPEALVKAVRKALSDSPPAG